MPQPARYRLHPCKLHTIEFQTFHSHVPELFSYLRSRDRAALEEKKFFFRARGSCRRAGWSRYVISSAWGLNSASCRSSPPPKKNWWSRGAPVLPTPEIQPRDPPKPTTRAPSPGSNFPDNGRRMPMEEGFGCPPHRTTSGVECTAMAVRDAGLTIFSRFFPLCRWR